MPRIIWVGGLKAEWLKFENKNIRAPLLKILQGYFDFLPYGPTVPDPRSQPYQMERQLIWSKRLKVGFYLNLTD